MIKWTTTLLLTLIISCCVSETWAQVRSYSNEFLSLGVGARALGMGNVQTAIADDVTAGFWNPAGLANIESLQVGAMHAEWFAGIAKYDYLSTALPISGGDRAIGLSAIRFAVDDIPNTLYLIEPDGSVNYDNISTFSAADYAFLLSYAQPLGNFRVGGNVKIIHRRVGGFANAWGVGLDLGAQYDVSDRFSLGLTLKDVTTTLNRWSFNFTEEEKQILDLTNNVIPVNSTELTGQRAVLGAAYEVELSEKLGLLAELDLDITFDGKRNVLLKSDFASIDPHFGFEFNYNRTVFLRAGINNIQQFQDDITGEDFTSIQPNVGIGLRIKEVQIDYAFNGLNKVSDGVYSHVFSLILHFNKKQKNNSIYRPEYTQPNTQIGR